MSIQKVVSVAREKQVVHLDLSSNHVDRAVAGETKCFRDCQEVLNRINRGREAKHITSMQGVQIVNGRG